MPTKRAEELPHAMHSREFIRFSRRFESSKIRGYVLDVGPQFFLLALVRNRIWLDGFECFRINDVKNLRADPYALFAEAALKKRGERRPKKPRVGLANIVELLLSAGKAFPLVTITSRRGRSGRVLDRPCTRREPGARFAAGNSPRR
jgi:hypothetical protein